MPKKRNLPKGKKPTNEHQKRKYADRRAFITERNRKRKRIKHLSLHPNDIQSLQKYKSLIQ